MIAFWIKTYSYIFDDSESPVKKILHTQPKRVVSLPLAYFYTGPASGCILPLGSGGQGKLLAGLLIHAEGEIDWHHSREPVPRKIITRFEI